MPTEFSSEEIDGNDRKFLLTFRNVQVRGNFVQRSSGQSFRLYGRDSSIPARGNIIVTPPAAFAQHYRRRRRALPVHKHKITCK